MDRICRDCMRPYWACEVDDFDDSGLCPKCNRELAEESEAENE